LYLKAVALQQISAVLWRGKEGALDVLFVAILLMASVTPERLFNATPLSALHCAALDPSFFVDVY